MVYKEKTHISIVVVGHHRSGKSTLAGHLLYKLGTTDRQVVDKYERDAADPVRKSYKFAWVLDRTKAERERMMSLETTTVRFDTDMHMCTLLDAPGHRDYIRNMVSGAVQADVAILVVDAQPEGLEAALGEDGQALEHALLIHMLGIKQLLVVVNKMDQVDYSQERFEEVKAEVTSVLLQKRKFFPVQSVSFIPASAWIGENLNYHPRLMPWWQGDTLLAAIDKFTPPPRSQDKPLRLPIQDVYRVSGIGTVPTGRIESGVMYPGMIVTFCPGGITTTVKSVEMHGEVLEQARHGDNVGFNIKGVGVTEIERGMVCSDATSDPAREAASFTAKVLIFNTPGKKPLHVGYAPIVMVHTAQVACRVKSFKLLDKKSHEPSTEQRDHLKKGDYAQVEFEPLKPLCVEAQNDYPTLARFAARDMKVTVMVGTIQSVVKKELETQER